MLYYHIIQWEIIYSIDHFSINKLFMNLPNRKQKLFVTLASGLKFLLQTQISVIVGKT